MSQKPQIETYWQRGRGMKKFHAFSIISGISKCRRWFLGGRAHADDIDIFPENEREQVKCKECQNKLVKK